jgi:hypothetical protein
LHNRHDRNPFVYFFFEVVGFGKRELLQGID